jgi:hypothetical protein
LHGHGGLSPSLHNNYSTVLGSWQLTTLGAYSAHVVVVGSLIVPLAIAPSVHSAQVVAYTMLVYQLISIVAHHILEVAHLVH